nr:PREDICTED: uncharacterized protein LOC109042819 [Bemisia tabaci]
MDRDPRGEDKEDQSGAKRSEGSENTGLEGVEEKSGNSDNMEKTEKTEKTDKTDKADSSECGERTAESSKKIKVKMTDVTSQQITKFLKAYKEKQEKEKAPTGKDGKSEDNVTDPKELKGVGKDGNEGKELKDKDMEEMEGIELDDNEIQGSGDMLTGAPVMSFPSPQGWKRERSHSLSTDSSGRPTPKKERRAVKRFAIDKDDLPVGFDEAMEAKRAVEDELLAYVKAQKTKSCIHHRIKEDIAKWRIQDDRIRCITADTVVAERGLALRNRFEDTELLAEKIARRLEQTVLEGVGVTMVKTMKESLEIANEARSNVESEVMNQLEVWKRQIERTVEENTEHQKLHYAELMERMAKMGNKITQVVACEEAREKNRGTEVKEMEKLKEAITKKEGIIKDMATKAESSEKQRKQAVKDIERQMEKMEKIQRETREELGRLAEKVEGIKCMAGTLPEGSVDTLAEKLKGIQDAVDIMRNTGEKLTKIERKQKEMAEEIGTLPREPSIKNSYSQMVRHKQEERKDDVKIILEDASDPDGNKVKEQIKDIIKDQGWRVQGLAKTKTGAILTVKGTEEEVNRRLKEIPVIREGKLTMREVKDKKPMVRINGVDSDIKEEELIEEIRSKNFQGWDKEVFKKAVGKGIKKKTRNEKFATWILEVSGQLRQQILDMGTVFVAYNGCRVWDHIDILRCYKCHKFGHPAKRCGEKEEVCSWCGKTGHRRADCKVAAPTCPCCSSQKIRADHDVFDHGCPSLIREMEWIVRRTDYGV